MPGQQPHPGQYQRQQSAGDLRRRRGRGVRGPPPDGRLADHQRGRLQGHLPIRGGQFAGTRPIFVRRKWDCPLWSGRRQRIAPQFEEKARHLDRPPICRRPAQRHARRKLRGTDHQRVVLRVGRQQVDLVIVVEVEAGGDLGLVDRHPRHAAGRTRQPHQPAALSRGWLNSGSTAVGNS